MTAPPSTDHLVTTTCRGCRATLRVPLALFDTRTCVTCRDLTGDWCPWMFRLLRLATPEWAAALLADTLPARVATVAGTLARPELPSPHLPEVP